MLKLKDKNLVVPGGWTYAVPKTGLVITAGDFDSLVSLVSRHMAVNGLAIAGGNLPDLIEDQICRRIAPSFSMNMSDGSAGVVKKIGRKQSQAFAVKGSDALQRTMDLILSAKRTCGASAFVPADLAEARAARAVADEAMFSNGVCYNCRHQGPIEMMAGRKLRTSLDPKLLVCGVFGGYLRALVHINGGVLQSKIGSGRIPHETFWLLPEMKG